MYLSPFFSNDNAQQLVLQSLWCDHEVEKSDLCGEFGEVVRVAQLGCDVETEVAGVFDCVVSQFDAPYST